MDKYDVLKVYFGYDQFKRGQEAVIDSLLSGRDALCVMPTGAGKSICYQIPAMLFPGITIVISPLISLMRDQVDALVGAGIPVAFLNSSLAPAQQYRVVEQLMQGQYKILYVAPERLDTESFISALAAVDVSMIAVDEAHCVSQWGQDFRPSYLKIIDFVNLLPHRPVIGAFTATATKQVSEDIERLLSLATPYKLTTGFDRPNLYFGVMQPKDKEQALLELLAKRRNQSGIVYCATRKNVEYVCDILNGRGIPATRYHAGLDDDERYANQEDFLYDRKTVMVATNAFGMGIDKSNVNFVIHYQMPKDMESYYQEAGRAGRDGTNADCIVLYSPLDVRTARFLIENSDPNPELDAQTQAQLRERELTRLKYMTYYCKTTDCLRAFILRYFGERASGYCGNCSSCDSGYQSVDITVEAQKIISCVVKTGQRVGVQLLMDILRGEENERIRNHGYDALSTFGIMQGTSETKFRQLFEALFSQNILRRTDGDYPIVQLAPRAAAIIKDGERVDMKVPLAKAVETAKTEDSLEMVDEALFEELKKLRSKLSIRASLPAYAIFTDATLQDMCRKMPKNREEFLQVSGVGRAKLARFGADFLKCIDSYRSGVRSAVPIVSMNRISFWTEEEDDRLRAEVDDGIKISQIAKLHGRTSTSIIKRMRDLGLFEE